MSAITAEMVAEHGITAPEYAHALEVLGREPSYTELGVLSVMWSEHCSYKSSRLHLRKLHTTGPRVAIGPGENAGAVRIGDGLCVVFKMESHNHPSYIEPYQGAATGMGGILRDVFTMGARPVAALNSLRFGRWDHPKTRHVMTGAVAGIGGYGNCFGVPTVGGETRFHPSYDGNCLVNAFVAGIVEEERIFLGTAAGVGNPVYYVGARTGRDGIHGATMASEEFGEGSEEKRPTVQVGDPFQEKLLLEACLELMAEEAIVGIQDMGAAGLTSSSVEMAGRGGAGLRLALDKVPTRETGMTPYELLLSESQERMLMVIEGGKEALVESIFAKWDLQAVAIGTVTDDGAWRCTWHGEEVCALPVPLLTDEAPIYDRPQEVPPWQEQVQTFEQPELGDAAEALLAMMAHPDLCEKRWIWEQYDHQVGTNTVVKPGSDAAVVRIKGTDKALGLVVDCNGRHVFLDPFEGAKGVIAECARNLACVGAEAIGATDCLNFGNPERPPIMWQIARSIDGLAEACRTLEIPVVSGNVSLYNETDGTPILPTPSVAMVGLIEGELPAVRGTFEREGLVVALLGGPSTHGVGGSLWLQTHVGADRGAPPPVDLAHEKRLNSAVIALVRSGVVEVAHDLSDGGLAVAVAECCLGTRRMGVDLCLPEGELRAQLFGEDHGRVLLAYSADKADAVRELTEGLELTTLGQTRGEHLVLHGKGLDLRVAVAQLHEVWSKALPDWADSSASKGTASA